MSQQNRTIFSAKNYDEVLSYFESLNLKEKKDSDLRVFEMKFLEGKLNVSLKKRIEGGDEFSGMILGTHNFFREIETINKAVQEDLLDRIAECETAIGIVSDSNFQEVDSRAEFIFKLMEKFDGIMFDGQGMVDKKGKIILDYDGSSEIAIAA